MTAIFLLWLHALTPAAHLQPGDSVRRRKPGRLYQVSARDEKSGRSRFGFIDPTGKLVIGFDRLPEATVRVGEFHEGRAILVVKEPRARFGEVSGYIDETGRVVIAPRFEAARNFSEGLARVRGEAFSGFIDRKGREVFRNGEWEVGDFHEGLASAGRTPVEPSAGYIDHTGRTVIERKYWFADDFSEGLAAVVVGKWMSRQTYGFINKKGEMVIPPRFAPRMGNYMIIAASRFSEGLACVGNGGAFGYIDKSGQYVIPPKFADAQAFSEGLAWVKTFDGKAGWIDKTGRWVSTLGVNGFHPSGPRLTSDNSLHDWRYSEGLVRFGVFTEKEALIGYLDREGRIAIQPRPFDSAGPFIGGLAKITFYEVSEYREGRPGYFDRETKRFMGEKYGYIDRTGRFVWRSK